jgi:YCII-related domain-containing protein
MKKFMLLFVRLQGPDVATQQKLGGEWMSRLPKDVVETAVPFEPEGRVVQKDSVADGHRSEGDFGGYMIIRAASLAEATKIAQGAPHVSLGGKIIVRPVMEM